ncbi:RNA polymerase sigma factor [Streptomyces sp. NPDC057623]|uniref:RNA polymerase sigma factor n=1 Tax=Streptomyces sp. NPDC057623 TaxID=3346187 RepID=UPI0036752F69
MTAPSHGAAESHDRLAASLIQVTGDFSAAEDLVQDAVLVALKHWPVDGIPERPDAWLFTVARRRGLDLLRRQENYHRKLAQLQWPPEEGEAGIPYRVPDDEELGDRLSQVLAVIYLLFNEGYLSTTGQAQSHDLADDAEWLAALLHRLMPTEPEAAGLLALIRLHRARTAARFTSEGALVRLQDQDRSLWDQEAIEAATALLTLAIKRQRPGPYQLQAAIVACHAEAARWEDTDWEQIVLLYDMLLHLAPSPVTRLHGAVALRRTEGPQAALAQVDGLAGELDHYHLFHAVRAGLLRDLHRLDEARTADRFALELTANPAQRAVGSVSARQPPW